jgi:hypothetical protein
MVFDLVDPSIRSCPVALPALACRHYIHEMPAPQARSPVRVTSMKHPLTDAELKKFLDDWNKSGAKTGLIS